MNAGSLGNYLRHTRYRSSYSLFTESLLVRVTTDGGLVGWGEPQSALVAHIVGQIVRELVAPALIGEDPFDRVRLRDRIYDFTRDRGHDAGYMVDAISACDIALWDLAGSSENRVADALVDCGCKIDGLMNDSRRTFLHLYSHHEEIRLCPGS